MRIPTRMADGRQVKWLMEQIRRSMNYFPCPVRRVHFVWQSALVPYSSIRTAPGRGKLSPPNGRAYFSSVSCSTKYSCIALTNSGGVYSYSNASWTHLSDLETGQEIPTGVPYATQVSCPTASFCMAIRYLNAMSYTRGQWSASQKIVRKRTFDGLEAVSCPTARFCMAVGDGGTAYIYSGSSG